MVLLDEIPRSLFSSVHNSESNCGPLSDMRSPEMPQVSYPVLQETLDACLSTAFCHGNCFCLPSIPVNNGEEIRHGLRLRQWADNVHMERSKASIRQGMWL